MKCDCECCRKRRDEKRDAYRLKRDEFLRNGGVEKKPGRPRKRDESPPIDPAKAAWREELGRLED